MYIFGPRILWCQDRSMMSVDTQSEIRPPGSQTTLWRLAMHRWAEGADEDFLSYVRQKECLRTVQWLVEAGVLNLADPLTRFEVEHCKDTILQMPRFTDMRPGPTTWADKRQPKHTSAPPPIPKWAKRKR